MSMNAQGIQFQQMTRNYHGGRRSRRQPRRQRGGMLPYNQFAETLPQNMHAAANITTLDNAFAQLPEFSGKYGSQTGGTRRRYHGGSVRFTPADVNAPTMAIPPEMEPKAFLNPQWYTENQVIPSFHGPANALYNQKAGKRTRRAKNRRAKTRRAKTRRTRNRR